MTPDTPPGRTDLVERPIEFWLEWLSFYWLFTITETGREMLKQKKFP